MEQELITGLTNRFRAINTSRPDHLKVTLSLVGAMGTKDRGEGIPDWPYTPDAPDKTDYETHGAEGHIQQRDIAGHGVTLRRRERATLQYLPLGSKTHA